MSEDQTTPDELPPPPPPPRFVATLRGIQRWDGGGHVFIKDQPVTVFQRTRDYLENVASGLFEIAQVKMEK